MADITEMLTRWRAGDVGAQDDLIAAVYPLLHDIAELHLRKAGRPVTMRATELAHEAYLRLERQRSVDWQNRSHFLAIVSTVVRRVLVDHLRQRSADKRGRGLLFVSIDDGLGENSPDQASQPVDWLAVDQALTELAAIESDCARVVELRVFGGLTTEEISDVCGFSTATVGRQWRFARTWLADRLDAEAAQ